MNQKSPLDQEGEFHSSSLKEWPRQRMQTLVHFSRIFPLMFNKLLSQCLLILKFLTPSSSYSLLDFFVYSMYIWQNDDWSDCPGQYLGLCVVISRVLLTHCDRVMCQPLSTCCTECHASASLYLLREFLGFKHLKFLSLSDGVSIQTQVALKTHNPLAPAP